MTLDGIKLPRYVYMYPLKVLENNAECVGVLYDGHSYWFDKRCIERYI